MDTVVLQMLEITMIQILPAGTNKIYTYFISVIKLIFLNNYRKYHFQVDRAKPIQHLAIAQCSIVQSQLITHMHATRQITMQVGTPCAKLGTCLARTDFCSRPPQTGWPFSYQFSLIICLPMQWTTIVLIKTHYRGHLLYFIVRIARILGNLHIIICF